VLSFADQATRPGMDMSLVSDSRSVSQCRSVAVS